MPGDESLCLSFYPVHCLSTLSLPGDQINQNVSGLTPYTILPFTLGTLFAQLCCCCNHTGSTRHPSVGPLLWAHPLSLSLSESGATVLWISKGNLSRLPALMTQLPAFRISCRQLNINLNISDVTLPAWSTYTCHALFSSTFASRSQTYILLSCSCRLLVPSRGQYDCLIAYMNNRLPTVLAYITVLLHMLPRVAPRLLFIFHIVFDLLVLHFSCIHPTPPVHMTDVQ